MHALLDLLLALAAVPVALACLYLAGLALLSRRPALPPPAAAVPHFDLLVPAHDEEGGIAATVKSLLALDWPADRRRVVVIADNCTDATAALAREAGAMVMERHDTERRGKGFALAYAMDRLLAEGLATAIVVVDADTLVSPGLLRAFAARLERGESALQARYSVRNPDASWRTQLMVIAMALMNDTRAFARERLGLSATLAGNGMCFSADLLRRRPYHAFSIVEDLEYGLLLGQGGWRVGFVGEAMVRGDMPTGGGASATQRLRWEAGRRAMVRTHGWPMLRHGLATGNKIVFDQAVELLVPPLARLAAVAVLGSALAAAWTWWRPGVTVGAWLWWLTLPALFLYVARGWWLSGTGLAGLAALARAPLYLVWKIGLSLKPKPGSNWVRTDRNGRTG